VKCWTEGSAALRRQQLTVSLWPVLALWKLGNRYRTCCDINLSQSHPRSFKKTFCFTKLIFTPRPVPTGIFSKAFLVLFQYCTASTSSFLSSSVRAFTWLRGELGHVAVHQQAARSSVSRARVSLLNQGAIWALKGLSHSSR